MNTRTSIAHAFVTVLLSITLFSCISRKERLRYEKGVVIEKQYHAEKKQTGTSVSSSTYDNNTAHTTHEVFEEEKYLVVFKCEHNTCFSVNNPSVYSKLEKGDIATITYYEWVNKKGEVVDLEFVDANKRTTTTKDTNPNW